MEDANLLVQEECLNLGTVIEAIIKRSCIIDYGIVQKVVAEGVVDVSVAVAKTEQDIVCMTCVLANIASSSLTVNVVPHVGDRVLVVYPRMYDDKMFAVPDGDTKQNTIVNPVAKGYNLMSGIAILMNQYKKASHENVITVEDGKINAKLNKVEVTTTADGDITLKNPKATVSIDKDGNVSINAKGKYTFKNDTTDLFSVISDLNSILKTLKTEGSSSAQTISPDTVTSLANWEDQELKALLV
mgnify:CR=1 FL=1